MRLGSFVVITALALGGLARAEDNPEPQLTKAPRLITFVPAVYPTARKAAGSEAAVLLSIEIGADGRVQAVSVVTSAGADFDAAAVAAAKQFVFAPGEVDHKPAPVRISYRYLFRMRTERVRLGPQVNFDGVILERYSKQPLVGVKVTVVGTGKSAPTDAGGRFSFLDLPLGRHKIEVSGAELVTVTTEELLVKDVRRTVKYLCEKKEEGVDEEVVVRAPRLKKESVEVTIRTEEARRVAGTQGDTLKVVQNLPGVARSSFGSGQIIVWGSAPKDTRTMIDGVEVPALYHMGGLRSVLNADLVKSIELLPGGYGADYGRGLGGLVKVETRPLPSAGVHGHLAVDLLDVSGLATIALTPRLRIGAAGRYSILDRWLTGLVDQQIGDFFPLPRYDDYQVVAAATLRRDEELSLMVLGSDDHLQRSIPSADPGEVRSESNERSFQRLILRYTRLADDGSSTFVTPSIGRDAQRTVTHFGAVPTELAVTTWRYALRAQHRRRLARPLTLSVGVDLSGGVSSVVRNGSINLPPREGDIYVFGQPPGDDVNADRWTTHLAGLAPYLFTELTFGKLTLTPGLRVEGTLVEGDRLFPPPPGTTPTGFTRLEWGIDPRLSALYRPHRLLSLTAAVGLYHQPPEPEELSAVFGNPTLGLGQALHVSLGANLRLTGTLSFETVGFYKRMEDLTVRSTDPTPPVAGALLGNGAGRSFGGQVMLRQELARGCFGWITYSLSRSEREDGPGRPWRLFDYDQTHVLGVVASYEWRGFTVGARFRYATGMPRTPVVSAFYESRGDQYQPLFGEHNSIRIPDFMQLDLRVEKQFLFRRGVGLSVFLDGQNITNRKNPEEITYDFTFAKRDYITGLPALLVVGARVQL